MPFMRETVNLHHLWLDSGDLSNKKSHGAAFYLELEEIYQAYILQSQLDKKAGLAFLLDQLKFLADKSFEFARLKLHTAIFGTLICLGVDFISLKRDNLQFEILGKFYELKFKSSWDQSDFYKKIRAAFRFINRGVEFFNPMMAQKISQDYQQIENAA
jgi:hypothetical protein